VSAELSRANPILHAVTTIIVHPIASQLARITVENVPPHHLGVEPRGRLVETHSASLLAKLPRAIATPPGFGPPEQRDR